MSGRKWYVRKVKPKYRFRPDPKFFVKIETGHPLYLRLIYLRLHYGYTMEMSEIIAKFIKATDFLPARLCYGGGFYAFQFNVSPGDMYEPEILKGEYWYVPDPDRMRRLYQIKLPTLNKRMLLRIIPEFRDYLPVLYFGRGFVILGSHVEVRIWGGQRVTQKQVDAMLRKKWRKHNIIQ
jgi:hypothetical protein